MNGVLPYNPSDSQSIFEYSKKLLGKTLRDFLVEDYIPKSGKGGIGQMVENLFFFLETNSNPNADFREAHLELKATPLKLGKDKNYQIKERLVCNNINYCEVVNEDFEHSHFYNKCQLMLLLFYLYQKGFDNLDMEFLFSVLWKIPEKDLTIIRQDYKIIVDKIKKGEAHLLSEGDTLYLGACTKGAKGQNLRKQPFSETLAPQRAFSLKMSYMRTVLSYVLDSGEKAVSNTAKAKLESLVDSSALKSKGFEEIILRRFKKFIGKRYQTIAKNSKVDISHNPKNKFAIIAHAIASEGKSCNVNRTEEFLKAGLTLKTIRVQANGKIKEAMSFENIDYIEIAENDNWYDSRLYELFSSRFMFVIFKEKHENKEDYILDKVFFWTMPQEDLSWAVEYWKHIRKHVLAEEIDSKYWWKSTDKKKFHVRPKARKATDTAPTPNGGEAKKYCYWFNNDYVREIVEKNKYIYAD